MPVRRLFLVVIAALLAGCNLANPSDRFPLEDPTEDSVPLDSLVVGLVGTLSGPESWRGEDAFEGADLGVHMLNRSRRGALRQFELRPLDDGGDSARARDLVAELAALESTVGIIYAGPHDGLSGIGDELAEADVPLVLCCGDPPPEAHSHVFQVSPPLAWQAEVLASYLLRDRSYVRVGVLAESSGAGDAAVEALRAELAGAPRPHVVVRYPPGLDDLRDQLDTLRRRRVEAVVVHGSPAAASRVFAGLRRMGATYRTTDAARIGSAPPRRRAVRRRSGWWHPQVAGLDASVSPRTRGPRRGSVAADSFLRGAHFLPVQDLRAFRSSFWNWWGARPLGWERRSYEAALVLGWAVRNARGREDLAAVLEGMRGRRLSGHPVTLGPGDHVALDERAVGLWVVPRTGLPVQQRLVGARLTEFPWVPLARTFTLRSDRGRPPAGDRTSIRRPLWPVLFGRRAVADRPPPYRDMVWSVRTPPADPVH
jgi:Periplasmic binding protein